MEETVMQTPFFSIIVPVYKIKKEFLEQCVQSILRQSFSDLELILVEDGSPDDCGKYCDVYAEQDARIRVIHQKNQGVSVARNNGIAAATGQWILFVDSDDWIELDACQKLYAQIQETDAEIIEFAMYKNYTDRQVKMTLYKEGTVYSAEDPEVKLFLYRRGIQPLNFAKNSLVAYTSYYCWNKAYRTGFLQDNDIIFPAGIPFSEDKMFYLRCLQKVRRIVCFGEHLYHYRQNTGSVTYKYSDTIDKDRLNLVALLDPLVQAFEEELSAELPHAGELLRKDLAHFIVLTATATVTRKFYHRNWPYQKSQRWKMCKQYLSTPVIQNAIRNTRISEVTPKNALRLWLVKHRLYLMFSLLVKLGNRLRGAKIQ